MGRDSGDAAPLALAAGGRAHPAGDIRDAAAASLLDRGRLHRHGPARPVRLALPGGGGMTDEARAARAGVTRSMAAQSGLTTAAVVSQRRAQPNGWWGMVLF